MCIRDRNRHDNFFLTCHTYGNDEISAYAAVVSYSKVSAAVVGCQSCFAGRVAKLGKSRYECSVDS